MAQLEEEPAFSSTPQVPDFSFPAPSEFKAVSFDEAALAAKGKDYLAEGPCQHAEAVGDAALFSPCCTNGGYAFPDLSFAGYGFLVDGYERDHTIRFDWEEKGNLGDAWLGLADFNNDRWTWTLMPNSDVFETDFTEYVNGTGDLLIVTMITGENSWELNSVRIGQETASIRSIDPAVPYGMVGMQRTFSADVIGVEPYTYAWDFGGGATPNTSDEANPVVTLGAKGFYPCSLTLTNDYGNDTFEFTLEVDALPEQLPDITSASPTSGDSGDHVTFTFVNSGAAAHTFSWNFGGGAIPNTSTAENPSVMLSGDGIYHCTLQATNDAGSDYYNFDINISCGG